jgi:integrase
VYQRADGLWCASASAGYDEAGRRRRRTVYGKTKREALEKLQQARGTLGAGNLDAGRLTLGEYLGRWLETTRTTVEPNTHGYYERHVRMLIRPHLGDVRLAKLGPFHVEQWYATLERAEVSAAVRKKAGETLRTALRQAVRLRLIAANPAADVVKPKATRPEMKVLDPDQVARFLDAARGDRHHALYVLALDSGMRQGELFALRWEDVDFDAGTVLVRRSLEVVGAKLRAKEPKTKSSRRRITLSRETLDALHEHRKRMLVEGHGAGPVFCDTDGGWLRRQNVTRRSFLPLVAAAGLPAIRFHDLRHTCATLLLLAGVNPKLISERLGHANVQMTLGTYSHVLPTMQAAAAEAMGKILGHKPETKASG